MVYHLPGHCWHQKRAYSTCGLEPISDCFICCYCGQLGSATFERRRPDNHGPHAPPEVCMDVIPHGSCPERKGVVVEPA